MALSSQEGSADLIPGVDLPAVGDIVSKSTGVDMGGPQAGPPQIYALFDDAVFHKALDYGLKTCALDEPIDEPKADLPRKGWRRAKLVIGSSCRSTFQACKGTSTRLR